MRSKEITQTGQQRKGIQLTGRKQMSCGWRGLRAAVGGVWAPALEPGGRRAASSGRGRSRGWRAGSLGVRPPALDPGAPAAGAGAWTAGG